MCKFQPFKSSLPGIIRDNLHRAERHLPLVLRVVASLYRVGNSLGVVIMIFRDFTFLQRSLFLLSSLLLGLSCTGLLASAKHNDDKGPHWIRVSSDHFSVLTDADEKKGREVAVRLEQMRAVFGQLLYKSKLKMPEPLEIIALKTDKEYAQIAPIHDGEPINEPGFFLPGEDRNYIILNLFEDESWRAIAHPYAHLLLNYNYPPTQPWFDEGFAEYFSSIRVDNTQVEIGRDPELGSDAHPDLLGNQARVMEAPKSLTEILDAPVWLAVPDLFTMKHTTVNFREGSHRSLFYAQSWMTVHYLLNKNKLAETGNYFDLVENQKLPETQAIQQAYGMTVAQFDKAVRDYFNSLLPLFLALDASKQPGATGIGGQTFHFPSPIASDDVGTSARDVPFAEAQALVAEAALRLPEHRETALRQLNALAHDPKLETLIAHRALAWDHIQKKEFEAGTQELNQALQIDPKDPWVRYELALLTYHAFQANGRFEGLANVMQDLQIVLDWDPDFAEAYNMLAMARLEGGGTHSALAAMQVALQLNPRSETYLLNMARIDIAGKQWDAATGLLEHLKTSENPQIAQIAQKNLYDLPTLKKYGLLPQPETAPAQPDSSSDDSESAGNSTPQPATESQPDKRSVQFAKGKLISVDCSQSPVAVLSVLVGTKALKLRTEDYKLLTLVGADEFSCSWKNRAVAVNYKVGGKSNGDLVSLEVQ
jgi:tetratricopeptide (TPR) repeat protein